MMEVKRVEKSGDKFIVHRIDETGNLEQIPCQGICGAVIPPNSLYRLSGYYLFLGLGTRSEVQAKGKYPLLFFLTEGEEANPSVLINTLIEMEERFRFNVVFTGEDFKFPPGILPDNFFINLHKEFKKSIPWVRVYTSPYNVEQGINLLTDFKLNDAFEPPPLNSILREHLKIEVGELPDDTSFRGFHALRFIMGWVSLIERIDVGAIEAHRQAAINKKIRKTLTGATRAAWAEVDQLRKQEEEDDWL